MRDLTAPARVLHVSLPVIVSILAFFIPFLSVTPSSSQAQAPPITPSGLNTEVNLSATPPAGTVQYDITGGTRPGGGTNLFHSFGDFNVPLNNIANFLNDTGLPTSNILARVTGLDGNNPTLSSIDGTIQTTGFGNANLFLINPAGFLFGPNATLHVGGAVAFTSADYLKLTDNARFNAIPNAAADALLTALPVASFGFLGSNPGAITVQGSQFTVTEGTGVSLVGGNITIQSGTLDNGTVQPAQLSAPNGQIILASIGSPGELLHANLFPVANVNGDFPTAAGLVQLAAGSTVDVTGSGSVSIRGGQFVIDVNQALLTTAATSPIGGPDPDSISLSPGSLILTQTFGTESGSDIQVMAAHVKMDGARIQSQTFGEGPGGGISIDAQNLNMMNDSAIESRAEGLGLGGAINIDASSVDINAAHILSTITANDFVADRTYGPPITLNVDKLSIRGGGFISSESIDNFFALQPIVAGTITINASNTVTVSGTSPSGQFSRIESRSDTTAVVGNIVINTARLFVTQGARISSDANFGQAGQILITATDSVNVTDGAKIFMDTSFTGGGLIDISAHSIEINQAIIQTLTVGEGDAGAVHLHGNNITLAGGQINSQTDEGLGRGGDVTLSATGTISISGQFAGNAIGLLLPGPAGIFTTTAGQGAPGGDITVTAGQSMTMTNGASLSASSTGLGDAGNITINAGNRFEARDSSVTTKSEHAGGGNIEINARDRFRLVNSQVNASAFLDGGNITIDPRLVLLQNSQILAQSIHGNGGNITITTPLFLSDQSSFVSASSQFGLNGTVTIQSPTSNLSGSLGTLTSKPSQVHNLLTQRCAALANGQASSFVVAGREQLPSDPGSWLTSPLYAAGTGLGVKAEGVQAEGERLGTGEGIAAYDTDVVSLRRLTPARFLMANFADSEATGCHS